MNKFGLAIGVLTGFAGMVVYTRYKAAKNTAKELYEYEQLDSGLYLEEESQ